MTKEQEVKIKELEEKIAVLKVDIEPIRKQFLEVSDLKLKLNGALEYIVQKVREFNAEIEKIKSSKEEKKESK